MTIDIDELRRKVNSTDIVDHIDLHANTKTVLSELIDRLEAAEKERDTLRAAVRHEADCVEAAKAEIEALRIALEKIAHPGCGCELITTTRGCLSGPLSWPS